MERAPETMLAGKQRARKDSIIPASKEQTRKAAEQNREEVIDMTLQNINDYLNTLDKKKDRERIEEVLDSLGLTIQLRNKDPHKKTLEDFNTIDELVEAMKPKRQLLYG